MDHLVLLESLEFHHYHHQYPSLRKVPGGFLALQGCQGLMEMMVDPDQWVLLARGEKLDSLVLQGVTGSLVFLVSPVSLALPVPLDHQDPQVLPVQLETAQYHSYEMMTSLRGQEIMALDRRETQAPGVHKDLPASQGGQHLQGLGERLVYLDQEDQWALRVCKA